ncbi:MAG: hypothetical protein U1D06_16240 [Paracoccaceae bacterium]|nr:hypothetical protein [Paracoccaceae bacterium]
MVAAAAAVLGGLSGNAANLLSSDDPKLASATIDELNVKRLNVIEDDGQLAMVIGKTSSLPGGGRNGGDISGIIFFHRGKEAGGLITSRSTDADGKESGYVHLSFDQLKSNQTVTLNTTSEGDFVRTSLRIIDRATDGNYNVIVQNDETERQAILKPYLAYLGQIGFFAERIYLGSEGNAGRVAMLELKDSRSRP